MPFSKIRIYWPYFIFGAFLIVLIVNIAYIFIAEKTWRGVFTENSYEKGVNYNRTIEKIREQEKLGVNIFTKIKQLDYNRYEVRTQATNNRGDNLQNISSVLYILRFPHDHNLDFSVMGIIEGNGSSRQEFSLSKVGNWELETAISFENKVVQDVKYINLKPKTDNQI